jgi:hypothetical protein
MEMHQIRYFLAVADQSNFTRAAEKGNASQPWLAMREWFGEPAIGSHSGESIKAPPPPSRKPRRVGVVEERSALSRTTASSRG